VGYQADWQTEKKEAPGVGFWAKKSTPAAPSWGPAEKNTAEMVFAGIAKQSTSGKKPETLKTAAKCERSTDHSSVLLEWSTLFDKEVSRLMEHGDQTGMTVRPVRLSCLFMVKTTH
jgi:hypothetical protein